MCPATTSGGWTGGCGRARTVLHQGARGRNEHELLGADGLLEVHGLWHQGHHGSTGADSTACLTNLVHHQRDRVGFVAFDSEVVEHVPPSAKHMETVLHVLDRLEADGPATT